MIRFLLVGLGGALGSMARYGAGVAVARLAAGSGSGPAPAWPWTTFSVNVVGGLAMGLLAGWLASRGGQEGWRVFAAVGVLGGFTTFSAFSLEAALMLERRQTGLAAAYVAASVIVAVAALFLGLMIARRMFADALPGARL